jgi:hypothetical protein
MGFLWKNPKKTTETMMRISPDNPKSEPADIASRYFLLDKGCPGDSKTVVKFDGRYWRWIPYDKIWTDDQTITKDDWFCGHLRSITREEAEKIINSAPERRPVGYNR